jgi:hypothetical protein
MSTSYPIGEESLFRRQRSLGLSTIFDLVQRLRRDARKLQEKQTYGFYSAFTTPPVNYMVPFRSALQHPLRPIAVN